METATAKTKIPEKTLDISFRFDDWEVRSARPPMSDEEFIAFCRQNPDLRIEQDKHGNIRIMPPVSFDSGNYESEVLGDLVSWNRHSKMGKTFSSSTLFILPSGEKRMPDAAWVLQDKVEQLSPEERKSFARVVPDFVVEIRSPSDDIRELKKKMTDTWIANGVQLAWLLDPESKTAWIYRANGPTEERQGFDGALSGEELLPGFEFDLALLKT